MEDILLGIGVGAIMLIGALGFGLLIQHCVENKTSIAKMCGLIAPKEQPK